MGDKKIEESGPNAYRPVSGKEGLGMQIVRTLVASSSTAQSVGKLMSRPVLAWVITALLI